MENLIIKKNVVRVQSFIKKFNSSMDVIILDKTAKTAKDAAKALNCEVGAIIKSLVLKSGYTFLLCLVSGDKKCSFIKLKKILKTQNLLMATAEEVKFQTGFSIGGVAPVAHKNKMKIFIDNSLKRYKKIFGAAGHPNCVFKITYEDLIIITQGIEENISE